MRVLGVQMRDFRTYARAEASLGDGLTVVYGPNGAGKSNLLEALYFGCTGRSPRTRNDRELLRFGTQATRVVCGSSTAASRRAECRVGTVGTGGDTGKAVKRMASDGALSSGCSTSGADPCSSVYLPDRLELLKGSPALRRAHLDQVDRRDLAFAGSHASGVLARAGTAQRPARADPLGERLADHAGHVGS